MVTRLRVTIRGKNYDIAAGSKADVARALFEAPEGYSVSEVSKAIPMAYSQAHSIGKQIGLEGRTYQIDQHTKRAKIERERAKHRAYEEANGIPPAVVVRHEDNNARRRATARAIVGSKPAPKAIVWKGVCANCGHDIEARMVGRQNTFVHVNVTPEEYLKTIQFCTAFPRGMA